MMSAPKSGLSNIVGLPSNIGPLPDSSHFFLTIRFRRRRSDCQHGCLFVAKCLDQGFRTVVVSATATGRLLLV